MLKIESNLKINGRHWGLTFVEGIAYTANVALAAKLLLKGYVVTDRQSEAEPNKEKQDFSPASPSSAEGNISQSLGQLDQPVAGSIIKEHELPPVPSSAAQADTVQTVKQSEQLVSISDISVSISGASASKTAAEPAKPRTTKPRKRAVKPHAADAG